MQRCRPRDETDAGSPNRQSGEAADRRSFSRIAIVRPGGEGGARAMFRPRPRQAKREARGSATSRRKPALLDHIPHAAQV